MKIPYPGDLNPIETAVWAAEFVRVRANRHRAHGSTRNDVAAAIEEANDAVDDLRNAMERS